MSAKVSGVTNWVAPAVITTCTERSCFVNLLAISAALYAAIEAVTPRMMFMRAVSFHILDFADLFQLGFALDDNLEDLGVVCFSDPDEIRAGSIPLRNQSARRKTSRLLSGDHRRE